MLEKIRQTNWLPWALAFSLFLLTLASRVWLVCHWPVDGPGDGVVYTQIAKNVLEQGVYSLEAEAPFTPTLVRLPGYPLFIAAVYSIFGHDNNTAVRVVQAIVDTFTCVIVALLAFLWTLDQEKKRRNAFFAFLLAALCPFIGIYAATLLTETLTTFLMAAMTLTATLAFTTAKPSRSLCWWGVTGVVAAVAVLLRPDSGLFAAGIGLTLVISGLFLETEVSAALISGLWRVISKGAVFTAAFIVVLTPWTVRNYRLFGVVQPLAPAHAEMPGEFVPHGYDRWLRTWVDDFRFVEPMLWNLDDKPISMTKIPPRAFDSPEERDRVTDLIAAYDHPPGYEGQYSDDVSTDTDSSDEAAAEGGADDETSASDEADDESPGDDVPEDADDDENKKYVVRMTPEIDAAFGAIADERIARSPVRYYLTLPARRAAALWFDSHSLYYPFGGQISPVSDIDYDVDQQYWLPAFTLLMWLYTLLAVCGGFVLWRRRSDKDHLRWLILAILMVVPRIAFFATVENPEPRYVVELFAFTALLGAFFLGDIRSRRSEEQEVSTPAPISERLLSLDVFRGMTIAAMVLVNEPGSWAAVYWPLSHSTGNGATPADWVFPFFLFIVGVSITFSLGRQIAGGQTVGAITSRIVRRSLTLFLIGLFLEAFPFYDLWTASWFEPSTMRIMGILQRIGVCYLVAAILLLHSGWRRLAVITGVLLFGYWALISLVAVPGCDAVNDSACTLAGYIDRAVLGTDHIWTQSKVIDPEGLLSTLPAIATTLMGVLAGLWLRGDRDEKQKFKGLIAAGAIASVAGWMWSYLFPISKLLWTSSYAVYTGGLALVFLGVCYWLVDLKGYRRWSVPFRVFGSNAILLYVGSTIAGKTLEVIELGAPGDATISLQEKIFTGVFLPLGEPALASLCYAFAFVLISLIILWPFYLRGRFIKV